jgi:hypothetical protein
VRSLAIRRARGGKFARVFVATSGRRPASLYSMQIDDYSDLFTLDISRVSSGDDRRAVPDAGHVYAICVHGSHDPCCGTYGARIYRAAQRSGARILLSSHVGGCRFAPNILCLPEGLLYGHVSEDEVASVIEHHERGLIYLDRYRGRTSYAQPVQVAEFFLRRETGILDYRELVCTEWMETNPGQWLTRFSSHKGKNYQVVHRRSETPLKVQHECGSAEDREQFQHDCVAVERIG